MTDAPDPRSRSFLPDVTRWSLRLRVFLFFALIALLGALEIVAASVYGYSRLDASGPVSAFVLTSLVSSLALIGLVTWVWLLFDENVAKPLQALASDMRARAHAGVAQEIDHAPARYLGDLAPAASAVTRDLVETRSALEEAVARETARIAAEKTRLETLLRDAPAGVLLCTADHKVALYNTQAARLLRGAGELGLNRPLFDVLRDSAVLDAYGRLRRRVAEGRADPGDEEDGGAVELLCSSLDGAQLFEATMRLAPELAPEAPRGAPAGYVLTLRDVTEEVARHADRDALLREMFDRLRRPAANLQSAFEALGDREGLSPELENRLRDAVVAQTGAMAEAISELSLRFDAIADSAWPMSDMAARDVAEAVRLKLAADGLDIAATAAPLELRCDGFGLALLLSAIARAVHQEQGAEHLRLTIAAEEDAEEDSDADGGGAVIDVSWRGDVASIATLDGWLAQPLGEGYGATGRQVVDRHGAEIWPEAAGEGLARLRLPIRQARPLRPPVSHSPSLEFYDFELLNLSGETPQDERRFEELTFVVFDTETTGLEPDRGDEVVQVAATRVVNGRMLAGESFDALVNPERPIPSASTQIHGISEEMVADAPTIAEIGRRFHRYCGDCVLVAHNAPFDMAFLRRHEKRIGARFDQPILDTVLISAVLYGRSAEHSLDAIAERLQVTIPPELRHTALGDAVATTEVLLKMLPMLSERGVGTLGALKEACAQHAGMMTRRLDAAPA